jgi:hypothetical protein
MPMIGRALLATAALGAVLAAAPPAGAAPAPAPGALAVLPAHGTDTTALTLVTARACPGGSNAQAAIAGPGFPASGQNIVGNTPLSAFERTTTGGLSIPVSLLLRDIANLPAKQVHYAGRYRVTVVCRDRVRLPALGTFTATLVFTSPTAYTAQNGAVAAVLAQDVAPQGEAPGSATGTLGADGSLGAATAAPAPGGSGATAGSATRPLASSSPRTGTWLRVAGLLVVGLGAAGLLLSGLTASRRRARTSTS